ncbi:HNH endonuclease [Streptomyces sp. P9-A2]|uniref:HNH endonuclease n=1 Tax=Streptomyces sp. P9-A2 TaxID=3072284 RepID=UPI002FC611F4
MNARPLNIVTECPKWCTEDHSVQAGEDREHHAGAERELRLPDGRLVLEASLTLEPGASAPQLVVSGSIESFVDDVQLLGAAEAKRFDEALQRFSSHVSRMTATVRAEQPRPPRGRPSKKRRTLPASMQHAGPETRLYLAERDGRHCFYCRAPFDSLKQATTDHYVPRSVWACNLPANLVLACEPCNRAKDNRLPWPLVWLLLTQHHQAPALAA